MHPRFHGLFVEKVIKNSSFAKTTKYNHHSLYELFCPDNFVKRFFQFILTDGVFLL